MNTFFNELKTENNYTLTENGAITHKSTLNKVLDLFAFGGAYRNRSDEDCILLFKQAYDENPELALKCLFYIGDCRGGQGERKFFRICFNWLAKNDPAAAHRNIELVPVFRRWDDLLYSCVGTPVEVYALAFIKKQLTLDLDCDTPSLLAKWLPSENASSAETKKMGHIVRTYLELTHKEYRQILSVLRSRINVLEKLMSEGRWDEIQFDKIPSKAGLIYKNAFARNDVTSRKYEEFIKSKKTKVNADTLYPYEIARQAFNMRLLPIDDPKRVALDKYWSCLKDYYNGREENGLCVVDVSGSMSGLPMEAAVSMGAYIAERGYGPFANHFITFSQHPELIEFDGVDIVDKFNRCREADWGYNTNIEAVFDMLLGVARRKHVDPEDIPTRLYIFSDMEFDAGLDIRNCRDAEGRINTLLESIVQKWKTCGYDLPQVIFWNLDARQNNIPAINGRFAYVSGFSMAILESILSGKDGVDLMLEKLLSDRYTSVK